MQYLDLPEPVAAYFAADLRDGDAVARCFTRAAVVKDEGHTYVGHAAIVDWKSDASTRYTYVSEPFELKREADLYIVRSRLTGDFPGSPTDLSFSFRLERGKIASLEITP